MMNNIIAWYKYIVNICNENLEFISAVLTIMMICILVIFIFLAANSMIKDFRENLKSKRLFLTTLFIIMASLMVTYVVAWTMKNFDMVPRVGSADAWIGFAGSAMGGLITMLALYFTLAQNQEMIREQHAVSLKPYVSCYITNLDQDEMKLQMDNCIEEYEFIECKMKNVSNNIANGIKIIDEYFLVKNAKGVEDRLDDLLDLFGISMYTVPLNEGIFLAPQDEYNWKTNISVEPNKDGKYKWDGSAFDFNHIIVFELTDAENVQKYEHIFQYELNINVDINDKLHFFLWNISNSIKTSEV